MLSIIDRLTQAVALFCGGFVLILLMALIVADVTARYALNSPIYGALDLYSLLLSLIVAACIAYGGRTGAHVSADLFTHLIPPGAERYVGFLTKLLAAAVVSLWAWQLYQSGGVAARLGESTQLLGIPFQLIYLALAIGIGLYAVVLIAEAILIAAGRNIPSMSDENPAQRGTK